MRLVRAFALAVMRAFMCSGRAITVRGTTGQTGFNSTPPDARISVRKTRWVATAASLILSACAGRDPHPVAVVQPQDQFSDCAMVKAEIEANNVQARKLAEENGLKVAQNVLAGVGGIVFFPVWLAMDAKGAAGTEADALKSRQEFLSKLAEERCAPGYRTPRQAAPYPYVPPPNPSPPKG